MRDDSPNSESTPPLGDAADAPLPPSDSAPSSLDPLLASPPSDPHAAPAAPSAPGGATLEPYAAAATEPWPVAHDPAAPIAAAPALSEAAIARSRRALFVWLVILLVFGVGGLVLGQQELALLVAVAGVVMAAHAADFHPVFTTLYQIVSFTLISGCAVMLVALAMFLRTSGPGGPLGAIVPVYSLVAGLVMLATASTAVARPLARALFGAKGESHSFRLAARLTLFGFLIALPAWFATQALFDRTEDIGNVFASLTYGGSVFGYVILALAAVGFLVRRDLRATLARLGLTRPLPRDFLFVVIGVPLLFALNWAGESAEQRWFPASWASDQRVNDALAGALSRSGMVLLSLSAGIGEEITMRGALQPKLGLVLTSLFFAALHVQYSWFGMAMIFGFGLVLGTIRNRTNTVVVMAVHAAYDLLAMVTT